MPTTEEILQQILDELKHLHNLHEGRHPYQTILYPIDGSIALVPAGKTTFDLVKGKVIFDDATEGDLSSKLEDLGIDNVSSCHIHPYNFQAFALNIQKPNDLWTGYFYLDKQHHSLTHSPMKRLEVYTRIGGGLFVEFGVHPEASPVISESLVNKEGWLNLATTTDSWTSIIMRPVTMNIRTGAAKIMTEALASRTPSILEGKLIETLFTRQVTWMIFNTGGSNSLDYRIQGAPFPQDDRFITIASGALAANDSVPVFITTFYHCQRIQLRSTTAGSSTTASIYVLALCGV